MNRSIKQRTLPNRKVWWWQVCCSLWKVLLWRVYWCPIELVEMNLSLRGGRETISRTGGINTYSLSSSRTGFVHPERSIAGIEISFSTQLTRFIQKSRFFLKALILHDGMSVRLKGFLPDLDVTMSTVHTACYLCAIPYHGPTTIFSLEVIITSSQIYMLTCRIAKSLTRHYWQSRKLDDGRSAKQWELWAYKPIIKWQN